MDTSTHIIRLVSRGNENGNCTQATCPVEESIYGYRPNLGATLLFLIVFALSGIAYTIQGFRKPCARFFTCAMIIGSISEVLGYVAKMLLWNNPFSDPGFKMSIVMLTFAPAFYAAGIYYTLKHICLTFGPSFSRLRPALYTTIFISCDVFSILLQAAGGALSSAANTSSLLDAGADIMIAGLVFQVFTLIMFGALAADYGWRVYCNRGHLNRATAELRRSLKFRLFMVALWISYFGILVRCCYRVAELAKGWTSSNTILREQNLFVGLDSVPVAVAAVVLNICHPGWCFPKDQEKLATADNKLEKGSQSDEEAGVA